MMNTWIYVVSLVAAVAVFRFGYRRGRAWRARKKKQVIQSLE